MSLLLTCIEFLTSASCVKLLAVRAFVLSYTIHFLVYLSQCEVERTDLASQNHNFLLLQLKRAYSQENMIRISAHDPISVSRLPTCDQSAPQECRLQHQLKIKIKIKTNRVGFKTRPLTFRLGQVTSENQHFPLLQLFIIDFKPSFKLRVALPKMRKKVLFYMSNASAGSMVITCTWHWTRTEQTSYFVALINVSKIFKIITLHKDWPTFFLSFFFSICNLHLLHTTMWTVRIVSTMSSQHSQIIQWSRVKLVIIR